MHDINGQLDGQADDSPAYSSTSASSSIHAANFECVVPFSSLAALKTPVRTRVVSSAGRQVFQYFDEDVSKSMPTRSTINLKQNVKRPKLWWILLGLFLAVISVLFTAVFCVSFASVRKAVNELSENNAEALRKYATVTSDSINELSALLDRRDVKLAKKAIEEYLNIPFLAVELLGNAMQTPEAYISVGNITDSVKYLWNIYKTLPSSASSTESLKRQRTLEGLFYADRDGTYIAYINQCSRGNSHLCLAEHSDQVSYGLDVRPGDHTSISDLNWLPRGGKNLTGGHINFYNADKTTGSPKLMYGSKEYDPRPRPWFLNASSAQGITIWTEVYEDLLYEDGGHPDIGFSAARAFFTNNQVQMVAGATLTLAHMTEILKQQEADDDSFLFLVAQESGAMVASSLGFDHVVCKSAHCGSKNKQLKWYEGQCNRTQQAVRALIQRYGSLAQLPEDGVLANDISRHTFSHELLTHGNRQQPLKWVLIHVQPADIYTSRINVDLMTHKGKLEDSVENVEYRLNHSMAFTAGVCFVFVLVGSVALGAVSHLVTKPLKILVKDMKAVAKLELDNIDTLLKEDYSSGMRPYFHWLGFGGAYKIREVAEIRETFASMTNGLRSFSRYMDPYVVQLLIQSRKQAQLGVAKADATVFFSDIKGFTSIAETAEPSVLLGMLSEYLETMSGIIMSHQGVVGEFIGDGIMAWWNVPWEVEDDTCAALVAAMEQQQRLVELRLRWAQKGLPEVHVRMGIAKGLVLAGNIGSKNRMKFGLVGDIVNLASRLENLCKVYKVSCLVDDKACGASGVDTAFFLRPVDLVTVKGRTMPTELHQLVATRAQVNGTPLHGMYEKFCNDFARIHASYRARDFQSSLKQLEQYLALWPEDHPAQLMKQRCLQLLANCPGPDWSPIENLTEK